MPNETITQMRQRHAEEIKNLQNNCKHEDICKGVIIYGEWMNLRSAVDLCETCGKTVRVLFDYP